MNSQLCSGATAGLGETPHRGFHGLGWCHHGLCYRKQLNFEASPELFSFSAQFNSHMGCPFASAAPAAMEGQDSQCMCAQLHPPPLPPPHFSFPPGLSIPLVWRQHTAPCSRAPRLQGGAEQQAAHPVGPAGPGPAPQGIPVPNPGTHSCLGEGNSRGWSSARLHWNLSCGSEGWQPAVSGNHIHG